MGAIESIWNTAAVLAPYLLAGLLLAGILHVAIPEGLIRRYLSGSGTGPIIRAAVAGIPLPLCSCGVIPVAQHLRREGAGKGATATFISSTPSTGVDSVSATWGMLGPGFAAVRLVFAIVSGILVGWAVEFAGGTGNVAEVAAVETCAVPTTQHRKRSWGQILSDVWEHGFGEILFSLRKWLLVGIVLGGLLSWLLPQGLFEGWLAVPVFSYLAMILASGPMYVCATGSIPIAASLVAKGMSPGAALVFLAVGPATNTATLGFIGSTMGRRSLFAYLAVVVITAVGAGAIMDLMGARGWLPALQPACHMDVSWWQHGAAALLMVLMFRDLRISSFFHRKPKESSMQISIPSISCGNCARHVTKALEPVPGVESVTVDVPGKTATVSGSAETPALLAALDLAGYPGTVVGG